MTKPSQAPPTNHSSSLSATCFGPPTMFIGGLPRPLPVMKSRTVGFFLPVFFTTRSRIACSPWMPAISASVKGSSMPLLAKSKFSASDSSDSASISSGRLAISAALSSASACVAAQIG